MGLMADINYISINEKYNVHVHVSTILKLLLIAATNFSDFSEKPHNH